MKMPVNLAIYINSLEQPLSNYKATTFYETVELINNKITLRMFAIRYSKKDELPLVKEVYRENENHKWINTDFYFQNMAGWCVCWEKRYFSYYGVIEPKNVLVKYDGKKPGVEVIRGWKDYEIRELDSTLKYLVVSNSSLDKIDIIKYIQRYKEYPSLELLAKAGFSYFYTDSRVLKLKGKKQKEFIQFIIANKKEVLENKPSYNEILKAIKLKKTYSEYLYWKEINSLVKFFENWNLSYKDCIEIIKYVEKQNASIYDYRDYLELASKNELDLTQRGVLYPRKLMERHDTLSIMYQERENKDKCEQISIIHNKLKELEIEYKGFKVFIPSSLKDFLDIGNALHNCVYSCDYSKEVAKGRIIIVAVCKDNQFIECCELEKQNKTLSIAQLRGDHNQDSEYHAEAEKVINKFIGLYNKNNLYKELQC